MESKKKKSGDQTKVDLDPGYKNEFLSQENRVRKLGKEKNLSEI